MKICMQYVTNEKYNLALSLPRKQFINIQMGMDFKNSI